MKKLALGTAQFGLPYGITNSSGRPSLLEIESILKVAKNSGINLLDTAAGYGDSECVIGQIVGNDPYFEVITKTIPLPSQDQKGVDFLIKRLDRSFSNLRRSSLRGLLVHRYEDLTSKAGEILFATLERYKDSGMVDFLGVSVYSLEDAVALADRYPLDIIQFPLNALDQRGVASGSLSKLRDKGVVLYARSIFLQGALLNPDIVEQKGLTQLRSPLSRFVNFANEYNLTLLETAVFFARMQMVEASVVGVNTAAELGAIVTAWNKKGELEALPWERLAESDADLVDPRRWRSC